MHKLSRTQEPNCLLNYRTKPNTRPLNWDQIPNADKQEIKDRLKEMQGNLCAYCEKLINQKDNDKEIEHFLQKGKSIKGKNTSVEFLWANLFQSCRVHGVCANYKDRKAMPYEHANLIKCDIEDPEKYLIFSYDGPLKIKEGLSVKDTKRASETIRVFNLNAHTLIESRRTMITGYKENAEELQDTLEFLGEEECKKELQELLEQTKNYPFATAIKHVLTSGIPSSIFAF